MDRMPNIQNNNAFLMAMGENSRIEIHAAAAEKDSWTQISQTAGAGDTQISLTEDTGWQVGDKIAIAATGFDMKEAEERTITAISADGRTLTLDTPLQFEHFGEVETHSNGKQGGDAQSWELDMRAEVALLSRNVTIQGDEDSTQDGYGGHTMVMDGALMHIDGAELTRMGQEGDVGRYPLHWHLLGDASGQYVTNASIHGTYNKGMTIHGTQNTWVEDNVIYDTIGHSYYFEDGSEFGNVLTDNLGMNTNASDNVPSAAIGSDVTAVSTFWVTNPNNHLIGNHAAGSGNAGFWVLSQEEVEGQSSKTGLYDGYEPYDQRPGQWVGNTSHSNEKDGIFVGRQFDESTGEVSGQPRLQQTFSLDDFTSYKNGEVAVWMRNAAGELTNLKLAESNKGVQSWGPSTISDSLIVGRSTNFTDRPGGEHHGWELYDQASHAENVHFAGFNAEFDAAIAQGHGWGKSANNSAAGLTFGDDVVEDHIFRVQNFFARDHLFDGDGTIAGALHDIDGSLTGVAGAVITPGILEVELGERVDIITRGIEGSPASGFNASAGAIWRADMNAWQNPAGSVIGKAEFFESGNENDRNDFRISRSDNGAEILFGKDAQGQSTRGQLNVDGSGDVEYTVEYTNGLPENIEIEVYDLPRGATATYRFKDLPSDVAIQGASEVGSLSELQNANETAWLRDANGDFVVKIYADRFLDWITPRNATPDDTAAGQSLGQEVYTDAFKIVIDGRGNAQPSGNENPIDAPSDNSQLANPTPLPDRADSTSETVEIFAADSRWSDAGAWDKGIPDADDVVIIGPGQRMVLDTSTTVKAIFVNGGELVVEDAKDIALSADWVLVLNGGLLQVGSEDNPFQNDFDLTLEGDDQGNDVNVAALMADDGNGVIRAVQNETPVAPEPEPTPEPEPIPDPEPVPEPTPEPEPVDPTPPSTVLDAMDDTVTTPQDTTVLVDVLGNDGDGLTIKGISYDGTTSLVDIIDGQIRVNPLRAATEDRIEVITYTVVDADGNEDTATLSVTVGQTLMSVVPIAPTPDAAMVMAMNIGSSEDVTADDGTVFAADTLGVGNAYGNMSVPIGGTQADAIYQTHAWSRDGLSYDVALADGTYEVELHFAEIYGPTSQTGNRVFDARIEDETIVAGLDVFAEAGEDRALVLTRTVAVTDGSLDIDLVNQVENAMLSGLKVSAAKVPLNSVAGFDLGEDAQQNQLVSSFSACDEFVLM